MTYKQKVINDIETGKLINASNIKTDLRTNKDMRTKYNNLLKINQAMKARQDMYEEITGISWEQVQRMIEEK